MQYGILTRGGLAALLLFFLGVHFSFGQGMSDGQVMQYVERESRSGASQSQIAMRLMQRGVTMQQLQRVRSEYERRGGSLSELPSEGSSLVESRLREPNGSVRVDAQGSELSPRPSSASPEGSSSVAESRPGVYVPDTLDNRVNGRRVFGRDIFNRFLAENNITLNNDVLTKILGRYQVGSRDELFYKLGSGEAGIDDYLNVNTSSRARSLVSRLFKLGFRKGKGNNKPARDAVKQPETSDIDPHKIVELHDADGEGREANYVVAPCCRPIPGDDVMGYLRPDGNLEIHALTCPEAEKIKATQGPRLVAVKWTDTHREFVANLCIEGVDRRGVLQEIAGVISTHMDIDMRRLNIEAHGEVFSCELDVKVRHTAQVDELCAKILKIDGVKRADRLKVNP